MRSGQRRFDCWPADRAIDPGDAVEVGAIDDTLSAAFGKLMDGDLADAMPDANLAGSDRDGDALADQSPGHRVAVGVDLDGAIVPDRAGELAKATK